MNKFDCKNDCHYDTNLAGFQSKKTTIHFNKFYSINCKSNRVLILIKITHFLFILSGDEQLSFGEKNSISRLCTRPYFNVVE